MVKHIILWQLKDELSDQQKNQIRSEIKKGLEDLAGRIDGLVEIHVQDKCLPSSNADLMLECTLSDQKALEAYAVNPLHVRVKDSLIAPNVKSRVCIDYEV